jgi:hypothetical protein
MLLTICKSIRITKLFLFIHNDKFIELVYNYIIYFFMFKDDYNLKEMKMAFLKDDFKLVKVFMETFGDSYTAKIIAQNNSSLGIDTVTVSYHEVYFGGVNHSTVNYTTSRMEPGEKMQILSQRLQVQGGSRKLIVTSIRVKASDGTEFSIDPPKPFTVNMVGFVIKGALNIH